MKNLNTLVVCVPCDWFWSSPHAFLNYTPQVPFLPAFVACSGSSLGILFNTPFLIPIWLGDFYHTSKWEPFDHSSFRSFTCINEEPILHTFQTTSLLSPMNIVVHQRLPALPFLFLNHHFLSYARYFFLIQKHFSLVK